MGMKQRISKVGAGVAVAGPLAVSGAVPAQALTDSGRQDCSAGLLLSGTYGYCYYPYLSLIHI